MKPSSMIKFVLTTLALVALVHGASGVNYPVEPIPRVRRLEGRVTLEYVEGERRVENKLAFTEVVDETTKRSKVTIGYVSWDPKVYYTRDATVLTVDRLSKRCIKLPEENKLLPEVDSFLRYSYDDLEIKAMIESHAPSRSPAAALRMLVGVAHDFDHSELRRSVTCEVFRKIYRGTKTKILSEFFIPKVAPNKENYMPWFAARQTAEGLEKADGSGKFKTVMTIDLFYMQAIDKNDPYQAANLEDEFNLPFGSGCSEFLPALQLKAPPNFNSFMMSYVRGSTQDLVSLAYDHEFNYLRKEQHGQSVSIWDMNEDLLYHTDHTMMGKIYNGNSDEVALSPCSVLKFEDDSNEQQSGAELETKVTSGSHLSRPYGRPGDSLDVFKFIGFDNVRYMGQSTARDLPCSVYETIVEQPPKIFQLEIQDFASRKDTFEYILQFFVFKTTTEPDDTTTSEPKRNTSEGLDPSGVDHYWPARVNLYARHKETAWVHLHESFDVQDFHWGLYGWQGKPSEMFMMPGCFDDEEEQLRIELSLNMKQTTPTRRQNIFTNYKYKLELDLQSDLFKLFQMSRLHLTEYSVALLRHNLLARLVISDRRDDKKLSYFGEGQMPSENAYRNQKLQLKTGSATSGLDGCIMSAAHVEAVSMVIFCPALADSVGSSSSCTVIYGESEPAIKGTEPTQSNTQISGRGACQVYCFAPSEPPKSAINQLSLIKSKLSDYKFHFTLADVSAGDQFHQSQSNNEIIEIELEDSDVTREQQLVTISNYKFAATKTSEGQTETKVRRFPSMTYETVGDCSRLCNLDSGCRSFSYCELSSSAPEDSRCLLSSLELRESSAESQLVQAKLDSNLQVTIEDRAKTSHNSSSLQPTSYLLDLKSGCSIHERDFMSMFTQTNEFLRIQRQFADQYPNTQSATACARRVIDLEDQEEDHDGAIFAFCAHTGTCLSAKHLFGSVKNAHTESMADEDDTVQSQHELSCQVFRKRYQTYFQLSPMVVKRPIEVGDDETTTSQSDVEEDKSRSAARVVSGGLKQIELNHNTVEECARACWNSFGHVCVSFDYCSPQVCIINSVGNPNENLAYNPAAVEYESRAGCLSYKRDLKWDQLRRDNLIGKHKLLDLDSQNHQGRSWTSWLLDILMVGLVLVVFDVGLIMGRKLNDRFDRSILSSVGGSGSSGSNGMRESTRDHVQGLTRRNNAHPEDRASALSRFNFENETYEYENAIQMDEIGVDRNRQQQPSATPTNDNQSADTSNTSDDLLDAKGGTRHRVSGASPQDASNSGPTMKKPDYIDVPNLI